MPGGNNNPQKFQCGCCIPARQIYYRAFGAINTIYHEDDHSIAIEARTPDEIIADLRHVNSQLEAKLRKYGLWDDPE